VGQPVPKTIPNNPKLFLCKSQHSHEERELPHSHPQFPRTTLGTPGTMTPHLATKYDEDDDERLAFLDSGFPTEALVKKHAKML